jgi:hypothetical protein
VLKHPAANSASTGTTRWGSTFFNMLSLVYA